MIPVREISEVVIIYPCLWHIEGNTVENLSVGLMFFRSSYGIQRLVHILQLMVFLVGNIWSISGILRQAEMGGPMAKL